MKNRLIDLLKKSEFDSALPLLSAMKETWPSDAVFTTATMADDDGSMSIDDDSTSHVTTLIGYLQHVFLGK